MRRSKTADPAEPQVTPYQPIPPRRRGLIVLLAIVTALGIAWLMLERVGAPPLQRLPRADAAPCAPGQTSGCVGGTARVIVAPGAPGAATSNATATPAPAPASAAAR